MPPMIRNPKDFWTGLIFLAVGAAFIIIAQDYAMGSARKMGPAYFPVVLAGLLMVIGLATTIRALIVPGSGTGRFAIGPMALVALGVVLFGMLVRQAGLVPSVAILVLVSAYASVHFRLRTGVLLAIGLAAFCALVFIKGLELPIPMFGPIFGE